MKNVFFSCVILLGFACGLYAQKAEDVNYVIGEQDVLSVDVWKEPDLSVKERRVRPDGIITLPLLGEIYASGKTAKQLQDEIAEKLRNELLVDPNVTVEVVEIVSQKVRISGQVGTAGQYALGAPTTVLDVIDRAGGPKATAKVKKIKIIRIVNGREVSYPFNYKDVVQAKNLRQNIFLENGDLILVP